MFFPIFFIHPNKIVRHFEPLSFRTLVTSIVRTHRHAACRPVLRIVMISSVHTHTPHAPGPSRQIQLLCLYILEVCLQHLRKLKTCLRKLKHFTCENVHISNIAHWNFELAWLLFLRGSVTYLGSSKKECRGVFRNLSLRLFADKVGGQALQFLKSYFLQFCFYDLRIH